MTSRRAKQSRISFKDVSKIAHEPDHVPESVVLQVRQDPSIFGGFKRRTHFSNAGLVEAVAVPVPQSGFGAGDEVLGGPVLGEELKADVTHAVVTTGAVIKYCLS